MNYLQLVQRCKRESGLAGGGPASIAAAIGDTARMCDWINDAWLAIQQMPRNWRWMRATATGEVSAAGGMRYTIDELLGVVAGATRFQRWMPERDKYRVRAWQAAAPATVWTLRFLEYDDFAARFLVGEHVAAAPQFWSVGPDNKLLVGPTPDDTYTVRADYFKSPQTLAADADEPEMPSAFHMAIVWLALYSYSGFDAAPEVSVRALGHYTPLEDALIADQGERIQWAASPLA